MTEQAILAHMRILMDRYSIEGLTCDGERSIREQAVAAREGRAAWARAVKLLGREPTVAEMYPQTKRSGKSREHAQIARPEGLYA